MTALLRARVDAASSRAPIDIQDMRQSGDAKSVSAIHLVKRESELSNSGPTAKIPTIATLFALAQDHRLDVFQIVVEAGPDGAPAGEIRRRLGLRKSLVSYHLKQLRLAGLVSLRREGRSFIHTAENCTVNRLVSYLSANCSP
jgi:DNA-binding transcriptional ArsR family regulator